MNNQLKAAIQEARRNGDITMEAVKEIHNFMKLVRKTQYNNADLYHLVTSIVEGENMSEDSEAELNKLCNAVVGETSESVPNLLSHEKIQVVKRSLRGSLIVCVLCGLVIYGLLTAFYFS